MTLDKELAQVLRELDPQQRQRVERALAVAGTGHQARADWRHNKLLV